MSKISVIIPVYNALKYTKMCIKSVRNNLFNKASEIIVINNASTDGTLPWLKSQKDIKVINNIEPYSVAAAFNQGARTSTGDIMLFMHNDVILPPNTIDMLENQLMSDAALGAVAPCTSNPDNWLQKMHPSMKKYSDMDGMYANALELHQVKCDARYCYHLDNFCIMIKKSAIVETGEFDETFLLHYFEDVDYSYRMQKAGWRLAAMPNVYVHHFKGVTYRECGINTSDAYQMFRNRFKEKWGFDYCYSANGRKELIDYIDIEQSGCAILDIGCAFGGNFVIIKEKNPSANLCGIEINSETACIAKGFADVRNNDIEKYFVPEWKEYFDYVIMGEVIEHLVDPWSALKKVREMIKPGGSIIASIPNVLHISVIYSLLQGNFTYTDSGIQDRTHMRFFTRKEIIKLFEYAGFSTKIVGGCRVGRISEMNNSYGNLATGLLNLPEVTIESDDLEMYQYFIKAVRN